MVEFVERKTEEREKTECLHDYICIGQQEVPGGLGFLFYCKFCLDIQFRAVGKNDEVPDTLPDLEAKA